MRGVVGSRLIEQVSDLVESTFGAGCQDILTNSAQNIREYDLSEFGFNIGLSELREKTKEITVNFIIRRPGSTMPASFEAAVIRFVAKVQELVTTYPVRSLRLYGGPYPCFSGREVWGRLLERLYVEIQD